MQFWHSEGMERASVSALLKMDGKEFLSVRPGALLNWDLSLAAMVKVPKANQES